MRQLILLGLMVVWLSSCGNRTGFSQEDGDTLHLKYSTLLSIVRHDGYTEVDIRNPWKEGMLLHSYILVPKDGEIPEQVPHGSVIRTPVERAAVFTTVHCSLLNTLGHGGNIVGCRRPEIYQDSFCPRAGEEGQDSRLWQWDESCGREDYGCQARHHHAVSL